MNFVVLRSVDVTMSKGTAYQLTLARQVTTSSTSVNLGYKALFMLNAVEIWTNSLQASKRSENEIRNNTN